ncbi:MAG TPA: DUF1559 domain-containing protein [Capsulimonadaceae bacterium]|jgi:prepilin-type N-terminal cleavage/methylation domain-containing protein/prepilin-type processing-associated H-X9-DG protein
MKKAFTLIELLVVIAIISILAAILFPVFATAREKARQTACLSDMKQIGLAYAQYEQDYDEVVPCGRNPFGWGLGWAGQIYPYVKSAAAFVCPNDTGPGDVVSYAANSNLVAYSAVPLPMPVQLSKMTSPAKTVMLFEIINSSGYVVATETAGSAAGNGLDKVTANCLNGANGGGGAGHLKYATGLLGNACVANTNPPSCDRTDTNMTAAGSYYTSLAGSHSGAANYLLADNHVKALQPTQVSAGYDTTLGAGNFFPATCPGQPNFTAQTTDCATGTSYAATFAYR